MSAEPTEKIILIDQRIPCSVYTDNIEVKAPVFLLVHGLTTNRYEYLDFYKSLASKFVDAGYIVVSLDLPSHGDSKNEEFNLSTCARDIVTVIHWLKSRYNISNVNVFACSFGATPALMASNLLPSSISSLTFLAPALLLKELYLEPSSTARESWSSFLEDSLAGKVRSLDGRVSMGLLNAVEFASIDTISLLKRISGDVRTRIIHGASDGMVPCEMSARISKSTGINLTVIPSMEHGFTHSGDETGEMPESVSNLKMISKLAIEYAS